MRFSDDLHVLWATPLDQSIVFATTGPVIATGITGRKQALRPTAGQLTLKLSAEPMYIQGNILG